MFMKWRSMQKISERRKPKNEAIYPAAHPGSSLGIKDPPLSPTIHNKYNKKGKEPACAAPEYSPVLFLFWWALYQADFGNFMAFFSSSIQILQTLVTAIGAGLGVWGVVNLLEGYGNDNPGAKSQGIKQLMAGGGVILIGTQLIPQLATLF